MIEEILSKHKKWKNKQNRLKQIRLIRRLTKKGLITYKDYKKYIPKLEKR